MASSSGRNVKTDGLFLGMLLLAVAASLIIWNQTDWPLLAVACIPVVCIGVYLAIMSFFVSKTSRVGPSDSSYYMVWGALLVTIGALGIARAAFDTDWIVIIAVFVIVLALLIIWRSVSKRE